MPPTPARSNQAPQPERKVRAGRGAPAVLLPLLGCCLPLAALVAPAAAAPRGTATPTTVTRTVADLGVGGVTAVNRIGSSIVVVGSVEVNGNDHAASWTYTSGTTATATDLTRYIGGARSGASGVDTQGAIVGWVQDSSGHQTNFRLTAGGVVSSFAGTQVATNPSGSLLVGSINGAAVRWSAPSAPVAQTLGNPSGTGAAAANDNGVTVGSIQHRCTTVTEPDGCSSLAVWPSAGVGRTLDPPSGWGAIWPTAITSTPSPTAVGYGYAGPATVPFVLEDATGNGAPTALPVPLPRRGTAPASRALGVNPSAMNSAGLVVGHVGALAAEWTHSTGSWLYKDISSVGSASGWTFNDARAIDGSGDIVGVGGRSGATQHAYLLLP